MPMSNKQPLRTRRFGRALVALALLASGPAIAGPEIQEWFTDAGVRVLFVETHEISIVDARLTFAAGSARDGDHPGIAVLTSNLLLAGTEKLSADALARAYEREGAQVSTGAARDMAWVGFRSLSAPEHLWPVVEVVAAIAGNPAFPPAEVERLTDQQLTALKQVAQSPGAIAERAWWQAVYGEHPYGHAPLGTPESVKSITPENVAAFHQRFYTAANANLAIVGDLSRAQAERLARELTADLPRGEPAPPLLPVPEAVEAATIRKAFPSVQSHVLIGGPAVARGFDHWPALVVANHIFGGSGFSSRLLTELREKRGLVYGAYSYFSPMAVRGPFIIGFQTRGDQVEEALSVARTQLTRFLEEGPTAAEVESAILSITGSFPLKIDSNAELVGYLAMIGFYGLPTDYLAEFRDAIEDVSAAEAHAAFVEAVGEGARVRVIVGGNRARDGAGAEAGARSGAEAPR